MKRNVVQTQSFSQKIDRFLAKKKLLQQDFEALKKKLTENPMEGDLIPGTGGLRKIRLKSPTKGTRGGFRVCYFDDSKNEELFLILIYAKNEQEDLTFEEKKVLKNMVKIIKGK